MIFKNIRKEKIILQLFHTNKQSATKDLRASRSSILKNTHILEIYNLKNFIQSIYLLIFKFKNCEVEIFKSFGLKALMIFFISKIFKVKVSLDISNIPFKPPLKYFNLNQIFGFYISIIFLRNCEQITVPTLELKKFLSNYREINLTNIRVVEDQDFPYWLNNKDRKNFYTNHYQDHRHAYIKIIWFGKTGSKYEKSGIFELFENIWDLKLCSEKHPNIKLYILIDFDGIKTIQILNEIISTLPKLNIDVIRWSWELQKDLLLDSDIVYLPYYPNIFNQCRSSGKLAFASNFNNNIVCGDRPSYLKYIVKKRPKNITNSSLNSWLENNINLFEKKNL